MSEIRAEVDILEWCRVFVGIERIRGVEERFKLFSSGKVTEDAMSGDWDDLSEHERLLQEHGKYS
jgi:hypothetical protein